MQKHDVINLLSGGNYSSYLEIGVDWGTTFNAVTINDKSGIDPLFKVPQDSLGGKTFNLTSDAYFAQSDKMYDCVFIDGLHTYEQSKRDFLNSWSRLKPNGVVILDDCFPADDLSALPDVDACLRGRQERGEPENMTWMGDVYKTAIWLNDCTDHAYAYVKESFGTVIVWQERQPHKRWLPDEESIASCTFDQFKSLPVPTLPLKTILDKVRGKTGLLSRLFR